MATSARRWICVPLVGIGAVPRGWRRRRRRASEISASVASPVALPIGVNIIAILLPRYLKLKPYFTVSG
jgi:hypothetical protein